MKTTQQYHASHCALLVAMLVGLGALQSHAQFNSGSDGSYGPMNITSNTTLALPTNGIFRCTTITVASNSTLAFIPNDLNTPVYLLATGDVVINGTIEVSGKGGNALLGGAGGPGGFAGGSPGMAGFQPGDGNGPGAGKGGPSGGSAAYGSVGLGDSGHGSIYGSPLLVPMVGGSGGGGAFDCGGSGGGGAVLLASNTRIALSGRVVSNGGLGCGFGATTVGSGGAIRLMSPTVEGVGNLDVTGGQVIGFGSYAGSGRIRIDCTDRRSLAFNYPSGLSVVSIGTYMVPFSSNPPRLDITQAADNNIPVGTNSPVFFFLPQGSSTNQTVTVQASNFAAVVPIRVVLTPDNGPGSSYDAEIDNSTVTPASVTVPVVVPVNVLVHVNAWTR